MDTHTPEHLIIKINKLTTTIETQYPELYQFLEEQPLTIPSDSNDDMNEKMLSNYLESLNQLLKHHVITHHKN